MKKKTLQKNVKSANGRRHARSAFLSVARILKRYGIAAECIDDSDSVYESFARCVDRCSTPHSPMVLTKLYKVKGADIPCDEHSSYIAEIHGGEGSFGLWSDYMVSLASLFSISSPFMTWMIELSADPAQDLWRAVLGVFVLRDPQKEIGRLFKNSFNKTYDEGYRK